MSNKRKSDDKVLEEQIVASKLRKTDSLATVQNNSNENESNKPRRRIDNTFSELTLLADNDVNKLLVYNLIIIICICFIYSLNINLA